MMTVKEVSNLTGVSIRTLQYYDKIGLLHPAHRTQAGYRLYDDAALERLQQILLFRELEFSLEDIRKILKNPEFDREKALEQQITLLTLKKQHLEKLIALAEKIRTTGGNVMDFNAFDTQKIKEYAERAKKEWGETTEYQEFEAKNARRTAEGIWQHQRAVDGARSGIRNAANQRTGRPAVQAQVKKAAGLYHRELLYLHEAHFVSTWTDVRCRRRVYGEYQRCRGRGRGRICSESH